MTARLVLPAPPPEGLQPMDLVRHLAGVADLVESCFASEMEDGGHSAVREMRFLSRLGPALPLLLLLDTEKRIFTQGYVWIEDGRVVGNVNMQPLEHSPRERARTWAVANVAVHPQQRRRGIAHQMMLATLDHIRELGGAEVVLMVDDDNVAAVALYRRLGFTQIATHSTWMRSGRRHIPAHEPTPFDVRLRADSEWAAEFALARAVRPEGLSWNRPLREAEFRSPLWKRVQQALSGEVEERWAVTRVEAPDLTGVPDLIGSLIIATGLPEGDRLTVLVHPEYRGRLERPLLVRGLRRLGARPWNVRIEHPANDEPTSAVLRDLGFSASRTLRWMKTELKVQS